MVDALFLGAHPDDYEAFAGGTILRLKKAGKICAGVIMTDGSAGKNNDVNIRKLEAESAAKFLELDYFEMIGLKDGYLTDYHDLTKTIVNLIRKYKPKILFTHYFEDKHPDHKIIGNITKNALFLARTKRDDLDGEPYTCKNVLMFIPDITYMPESRLFIDITLFLEMKIEILNIYKSQKVVLESVPLINKYFASEILEDNEKTVEAFYPYILTKERL